MRHYEVTLMYDPSIKDKDTHRQGARLTRHPHFSPHPRVEVWICRLRRSS
jgi:hypothetical protein